MSFNVQLPGSICIIRDQIVDVPGAGTACQKSPYSFTEKIAGVTNPLSLQADVIYPNALAEALHSGDGERTSGGGHPIAVGCTGHLIDSEFPLELKTPFAMPLVMYPSTSSDRHHDVDLCALPVLNWESYIFEFRNSHISSCAKPKATELEKRPKSKGKGLVEGEPQEGVATPEEPIDEDSNSNSPENIDKGSEAVCTGGHEVIERNANNVQVQETEKRPEIIGTGGLFSGRHPKAMQITDILIRCEKSHNVEETNQERNKRILAGIKRSKAGPADTGKLSDALPPMSCMAVGQQRSKMLPILCLHKMKNVPQFSLQGTWNYLFGGYNGACCFVRPTRASSKTNLNLFVGKGSLLRAVELQQTTLPYINPYKVVSIWDEDEGSLPFNAKSSVEDPFSDLIFQIIQSENNDLVAVRRGRSVQFYSTEDEAPYLLESVPNTCYGTREYFLCKQRPYVEDPLLTGMDFNPIFCSEVATIDENCVIRFCDVGHETTRDVFLLPKVATPHSRRPKEYPSYKLNEASGITFANSNNDFYAWYDSRIYRGDRRDPGISGSQLFPLFDVRNDIQMRAMSDQNYFHEETVAINEYISCVRRSRQDPYYYVGTTSKVYLMDQRVPSHPVLKVNHGLQSPLTYMDTYSDENFETLVGSSQRLPETTCMITNTGHTLCVNRPGCKANNPILHCYPSHLSNSRASFDFATKHGYNCSFPSDFDRVKNHHYAWTTGVAIFPIVGTSDPKQPRGIIVATSNNFGDIFCQEWNQKPMPHHRKVGTSDYNFRTFMKDWKAAVTPKVFGNEVIKPSKNQKNPVDCSILLEPAANEIKKLPRIRDYSFNCFQPNEMQYRNNLKSLAPLPDLISKLRFYKNEKVKGMLEVWKIEDIREEGTRSTNSNEVIQEVVIKEEPPDDEGSVSHSSLHTIDIDVSEHEEYSQQHLQELSNIERDIQRAVNPNDSEDEEYLMEDEPVDPEDEGEEKWEFENSQPVPPISEAIDPLLLDEQRGTHAQTGWFSMQKLHSRMRDNEEINFNVDDETNQYYSQMESGSLDPGMSQSLFSADSQALLYSSSQPIPSTSSSQKTPGARLSTKKKKSGFR